MQEKNIWALLFQYAWPYEKNLRAPSFYDQVLTAFYQ